MTRKDGSPFGGEQKSLQLSDVSSEKLLKLGDLQARSSLTTTADRQLPLRTNDDDKRGKDVFTPEVARNASKNPELRLDGVVALSSLTTDHSDDKNPGSGPM